MMSKFIYLWCLLYLCFGTQAEHSSQYSQKSSDDSEYISDVAQKIYSVTDLLRWMDELAIDHSALNDDRSLRRESQSDSSVYRENSFELPYGDTILNLLNNIVPSINQNSPLNTIASNYELDYPAIQPTQPFNQFGGLGENFLNALTSISRYDDLKCVPRILCEVASGKPPRKYRQTSTEDNKQDLGEFGRNALTQWIAGLNIEESSPILNFARAAVLGYSSNGNSAMCYRAFPRCPRNPDKLVHYLNNHNGGFFRFFNRERYPGSYSQSSYSSRGNLKFLRKRNRKAPPPGIAGAEADRTGTGKLKFDIPVSTTRQDYGESFFPKENIPKSSGRMVFPDHEESNDHPSKNRISKSLSDLQDSDKNTFSLDSPPFFPQESKDQRVLRFIPELLDSTPRNTFRFPH